VVEGGEEVGENEVPGSHVHGFFLTPYDVCIGVEFCLLRNEVEGEGVELLQAHNGDIFGVVICASLQQEIVHLAGAEDDASDLGGRVDGLWCGLRDDTAEPRCVRGVSEIGELREARLVTEEPLGCHAHKRLPEVTVHLAAKDVEVVGRSCTVDNTPVSVLHLSALALVLRGHLGGVRVA